MIAPGEVGLSGTCFHHVTNARRAPLTDVDMRARFDEYLLATGATSTGVMEVADFLAAGTAPVVVTLGTFQRHGAPMVAQVVAAARALGRRTVVLGADRPPMPPAPADDLLWQPYLPLHQLLPHAAALVHHGGIGTTAEALRAAVPQLVLPWAFDQFDNAQRVVALGESSRLPHAGAEAAQVAGMFAQGQAFTGADATLAVLQQHAAEADVLHLACHAQFRGDNPMFSALHLHDGPLTAERAEALRLRAGVVGFGLVMSGYFFWRAYL